MTFGRKVKEARKAKGMTQRQLAEMVGAKHNSVSDWENDKNKPDPDTIELICGVLDITPNYLLATSLEEFSPYEKLMIKKYRFIAEHSPEGAETVEYILNREFNVANQVKEDVAAYTPDNVRSIGYFQKLASAGTGQILFDSIPIDSVQIPNIPKYNRVSYAIGVNGNSMEPYYHDGDMLLVEQVQEIEVGEIGIFVVDSEAYVKKLGDGKLISLNDDYDDIPLTEYSYCVGRVVDKLER